MVAQMLAWVLLSVLMMLIDLMLGRLLDTWLLGPPFWMLAEAADHNIQKTQ